MSEFGAILGPASLLGIMILIGFAAEKTGFVKGIKAGVSALITNITLPLLVVTSVSGQDITQVTPGELAAVFGAAVAAILLLIAANRLVGKALKLGGKRLLMHSYLGAFGNVIFLAYPFITELFGRQGLFLAIIFALANDMLLWSGGTYFLARGLGAGKAAAEKKAHHSSHPKAAFLAPFISPNIICFALGSVMLLCRWRLPDLINAPLERLGSATVPLSMLFIGSVLAGTKIADAVRSPSIWIMCALKQVIAPLIFIGAAWVTGIAKNEGYALALSVIALQIAMPSQTILSVLADKYDADSDYASQAIFISTVLSAVTLPAVYFVCRAVLFYN